MRRIIDHEVQRLVGEFVRDDPAECRAVGLIDAVVHAHHVGVRAEPFFEPSARARLEIDRDMPVGLGQERKEGNAAAVIDAELEHPLGVELVDELRILLHHPAWLQEMKFRGLELDLRPERHSEPRPFERDASLAPLHAVGCPHLSESAGHASLAPSRADAERAPGFDHEPRSPTTGLLSRCVSR